MIEIEREILALREAVLPLNERYARLNSFKTQFDDSDTVKADMLKALDEQRSLLFEKIAKAKTELEIATMAHLISPEYSEEEVPEVASPSSV